MTAIYRPIPRRLPQRRPFIFGLPTYVAGTYVFGPATFEPTEGWIVCQTTAANWPGGVGMDVAIEIFMNVGPWQPLASFHSDGPMAIEDQMWQGQVGVNPGGTNQCRVTLTITGGSLSMGVSIDGYSVPLV